jgi:neutral amino acid transport system substrate-binding protein
MGDYLMMKKYLIALTLIIIVSFSGCIQQGENKSGEGATGTGSAGQAGMKVGVVQSLTGDLAAYGGPMSDAIKLAANEVNANGGINGEQISILLQDDQTSNVPAVDASNKLVKVDRVPVVIGATGSGPSMSIIDICTKNCVLQMSSSNTGVEFTDYKDNDLYFRTAPSDALQGAAMAKLAAEKGYKTASTIVVNNPYGIGFEDVFIKAFQSAGGKVLESVRYDPTQTIFDSEVDKVSSVNPDFVMMVSYPATGSLILRTAYQKGYLKSTPWIMSEGLMTEKLAEMVGKDQSGKFIIAGFQGVAPDQSSGGAAYQAFREKYMKQYGQEPALYCSNSYDAMAIVALAAEEARNATGVAIRDHIRSVSNPPGIEVSDLAQALSLVREGKDINYQGASGGITFDDNGDVNGDYITWSVAENGSIIFGDVISV